MNNQHSSATLRKGQFLWMEPAARNVYLQKLKERISEGYYYTDRIFSKIADELAPVLEEVVASH
ncbi:MAG: hypothetical protein JW913_20850 [Chitinispirillaceae bacterium]|nr:hypothetical protein [Chitinispirillaceae bacterium]